MTPLVDAVGAGRLEGLRAVRDRLAQTMDAEDVPLYAIPGLARELMKVLAEIDTLTPRPEDDDVVTRHRRGDRLDRVDLLAAQRQERRDRPRAEATAEETSS